MTAILSKHSSSEPVQVHLYGCRGQFNFISKGFWDKVLLRTVFAYTRRPTCSSYSYLSSVKTSLQATSATDALKRTVYFWLCHFYHLRYNQLIPIICFPIHGLQECMRVIWDKFVNKSQVITNFVFRLNFALFQKWKKYCAISRTSVHLIMIGEWRRGGHILFRGKPNGTIHWTSVSSFKLLVPCAEVMCVCQRVCQFLNVCSMLNLLLTVRLIYEYERTNAIQPV